jgi:hypothetical protein
MTRVPFQKLGTWGTTSFARFTLVFGVAWGAPLLLYFARTSYDSGGLSAAHAIWLLAVVAIGSLVWCSLMWFTVVVPLKAKLRKSGSTIAAKESP